MRFVLLILVALLPRVALAGSFTAEPGQGGAITSLEQDTSGYYQATGKIKNIESLDKSGVNSCPAGKTCIGITGHGFVNGDVVIIEGLDGTTELEGLTSVVESAAANTLRLPLTSTTNWVSTGWLRKRLWAPLGLARCDTAGIYWLSNIADAADFDGAAYPFRCPTDRSNALPPDTGCNAMNFGGLTTLTGAFGLDAFFTDVTPQSLVVDLYLPDAQTGRVGVDCR